MAISKFNNTTMLITEYVPNISIPQKRVNILIPSNSKLSKSTNPNTAQNNVCVVSNKLDTHTKKENVNKILIFWKIFEISIFNVNLKLNSNSKDLFSKH